jgi:hypothetical protein
MIKIDEKILVRNVLKQKFWCWGCFTERHEQHEQQSTDPKIEMGDKRTDE